MAWRRAHRRGPAASARPWRETVLEYVGDDPSRLEDLRRDRDDEPTAQPLPAEVAQEFRVLDAVLRALGQLYYEPRAPETWGVSEGHA
ncbi:MAG: hypothetical protein P4L84_04785 [Isosphaeraceae bacterium]|nr:hypothetical protein [Isosphaeraceae bacterium]